MDCRDNTIYATEKKADCKKNSDQYVEYPVLCQENGYIFSMFFNNIGALGFTTCRLIKEKMLETLALGTIIIP